MTFLTLPRNGRGVYQVFVEVPVEGAPEPAEGEEALHEHFTYFVDPGSGEVTDPREVVVAAERTAGRLGPLLAALLREGART